MPPAPTQTLQQRLQFLLLTDRLKSVERRTLLSDASRHENSAEHSWHLALAVTLFSDLAREKIDVAHAVQLALLHDVVEIEAGDTYVYDVAANQTQAAREQKAADEIFGVLPAAQNADFRALWEEFEAHETPEARFVRALDRMLPLLFNFATDGRAWRNHGIQTEQVRALNLPLLEVVPELRQYCVLLIEEAERRGFLRAK